MFRSLTERYRSRQQRLKEERLEEWETKRHLGMTYHVLRKTLLFVAPVMLIIQAIDLFNSRAIKLSDLFVQVLFLSFGGLYIGFTDWRSNEDAYLNKNRNNEHPNIQPSV